MSLRRLRSIKWVLDHFVKPLGDAEYQKRVWVDAEGPEVSFYEEAIEFFFSRTEEVFEDPNSCEGINDFIINKLKNFYDLLGIFTDEIGSKFSEEAIGELIETPEWKEVQKAARETCKEIMDDLEKRGY